MHVLIIDDHPLLIRGMEALLIELEPNITTAGARTIAEALEKAKQHMPDLVLLDLNLPGVKDLEALKQVASELQSVPIVVVSGNDRPDYVWKAIEMNAAGYIPKDTDPGLMTQALKVVLARGIYIPAHAVRSAPLDMPASPRNLPSLSDRHMSVLRRLLQGKSNKLIARELGMAESTVKSHLSAIFEKLGVSTRLQAMARAHELQIVEKFGRVE